MGTVYKRGNIWWIGYRDAAGKWVYESAETHDERHARKRLAKTEALIAKSERVEASPRTLNAYAIAWSKEREGRVWTAKKELGRLKNHVLPKLGAMKLADIRPHHVRELVKALRVESAPRSVRNIYGVLHRLFEDAVAEELVDVSPCKLSSGDMPSIQDSKKFDRETAEYTRAEVAQLISDERIPMNRRVWWALGFLAGMRSGEIAALKWSDYEPASKPLGKLTVTASFNSDLKQVKSTKTGRRRDVPVHPTLAAMLAEWRLSGWAGINGRPPLASDLLLTNEKGRVMGESSTKHTRPRDLKKLGMRIRRFHDARSTFITLGTVDGGEEVWLERVTHNAKGSQFNQYRRTSWPKLCEAVACLQIERVPGGVLHSSLQRETSRMQTNETTNGAVLDNQCGRRDSKTPTRKRAWRAPVVVTLVWPALGSVEPQPEGVDRRNVVPGQKERLRALMDRYAAGGR